MDALLHKLYYSPQSPSGFSRPVVLWREARKHLPTITLQQVRNWYRGQDVPSRFQQAKHHFPRSIFVTRAVNIQWLADLADLGNLMHYNKKFRYILVVQDLFSRRLLGLVALKRKLSQEVAQALQQIIDGVGQAPHIFFTDQGWEFFGDCKNIYNKYNIKHVTTNDFTQKAAPVERAILVLKQRLYKVMNSQKSLQWTDKLTDIMTAFNNSYNRTLGMTPAEAALPKNQIQVFKNSVADRELEQLSLHHSFRFPIGSLVRILKEQPFGKSYVGNYSQVVYRIRDHKMKGGLPTYSLEEFLTGEPLRGIFYEQELTPITLKNQQPKKKPEKIHSFRLKDNREQVLVSYPDGSGKVWVDYSELLGL